MDIYSLKEGGKQKYKKNKEMGTPNSGKESTDWDEEKLLSHTIYIDVKYSNEI